MFTCGPALFRSPRPVIAGGGGGGDPYWANVVGLWHFDETAGSTTFVDSSSSANNMVRGSAGGAMTSSAQAKFGPCSFRLTDGWDEWAEAPHIAGYKFGTGDFTIEFWMRIDALSDAWWLFDMRGGGGGGNRTNIEFQTGGNAIVRGTVDTPLSVSGFTAATWHNLAYSRVGTTGYVFRDGANVSSSTDSTDYSAGAAVPTIGFPSLTTPVANCYLDELRITNGVGRYTANYTVASAAFPNF